MTYTLKKAHQKVLEVQPEAFNRQRNFLLTLSHEIRNPLNTMLGNLQIILMSDISKEVEERIKTAQVCGELLVNLMEIYRNIPPIMKIDTFRLTQILMNLLSNAVKFTDKGTVTMKVMWLKGRDDNNLAPEDFDESINESIAEELEKNHLYFTVLRQSASSSIILNNAVSQKGILRIDVYDTGCGIPPEGIDKLFTPYAQLSQDASRRGIGTGLGLYITKQLCLKMKGDIHAYSTLGKGTRIVVCIPH